jgi:hypothetical protein
MDQNQNIQYRYISAQNYNTSNQPILTPKPIIIAKAPQIVQTSTPALAAIKMPDLINTASNTEETKVQAAATNTDDLIKKVHRGTNTDIKLDMVTTKALKMKVNHFNEGFRTYYDDVS